MRNATVKRALASDADRAQQGAERERGIERVDPTPALNAVLIAESWGFLRLAAKDIAWLLGIVALAAVSVAFIAQQTDGLFWLTPNPSDVLWIVAACTGVLALILFLRRLYQSQTAMSRLAPERRRFSRTTGPLRLQERLNAANASEYWLKPPRSDWLAIDRSTFEQLEPITVRAQSNDLDFRRQTNNDVAAEWSVPDATILYHRHAGIVVEIVIEGDDVVYRHPRYQPEAV